MKPRIQPVAELREFTGARLVAANDDSITQAGELKNSDEKAQRAAEALQRQGGVL